MDADGTKAGYALDLLGAILARVSVPVVASGGAAGPAHMADALEAGCSAALAASIFHDGTFTVEEVKDTCRTRGIPVR
jgi:cyclase